MAESEAQPDAVFRVDIDLQDLMTQFLDSGMSVLDVQHDVDDDAVPLCLNCPTSTEANSHLKPCDHVHLKDDTIPETMPSARPVYPSTPVRLEVRPPPANSRSTPLQKRAPSLSPPAALSKSKPSRHSRGDLQRKALKHSATHRSSSAGLYRADGFRGRAAVKILENATVTTAAHIELSDIVPPNMYTGHSARRVPAAPPTTPASTQWIPSSLGSALPDEVQKWLEDGFVHLPSDPSRAQLIKDAAGRIVVVNAKQPSGSGWHDVVQQVDEQLAILETKLRASAANPGKGTQRADGAYKYVSFGVSAGQGQREPDYLCVRAEYHEAIQSFCDHPAVQRYMKHANGCLKTFFPFLHLENRELAKSLSARTNGKLHSVFPTLPMMAMTANAGPAVRTLPHLDLMNASFGRCIVGPTGSYDHTRSGLLVLKELKVIMEIAPGDIVLIPSALITHSNTSLAAGEIRRSITLYTAGALYRWVDAGGRMLNTLSASELAKFHEFHAWKSQERFKLCNPTHDDLVGTHIYRLCR